MSIYKLSLNTTGSVAAGEFFNFCNRNAVIVAFNGMFESGSGNSKVDGFLGGFSGKESVDKTAAEGISAANAVDDSEVIGAAEAIVFAVIKHTCPIVVACGN